MQNGNSAIATGQYPDYRPRRLRATETMRRMVAQTSLEARQLILPFFVRSGKGVRNPIASMPGVAQLSPDEMLKDVLAAYADGVGAVILFGIPDQKDAQATGAYAEHGIVQQAVRLLKAEIPQLLVITDVCLCEYMSHGHCGIVSEAGGKVIIQNDSSLELLARSAVSHAEAGADLVAPSDMMDGRVQAIRIALRKAGLDDVPILSYAAKFASAFYGPFRDAAESAPKFGDRRSYQMDGANLDEAMREVAMDINEGADMIMVKPALAYLDVLTRVKSQFGYPTVAYSVSGEYSMMKAAAERGWVDERGVFMESHLSMRRAGADLIITYAARDLAKWLKGGG